MDIATLAYQIDARGAIQAARNLDQMSESAQGATQSQRLLDEGSKLFTRSAMAATAAIAGTTAALAALTMEGLSAIDAQAKLSRSMGATIDGLRAVQLAASEGGVDGIEASLTRLDRRLGAVAMGGGPAADAVEGLGLNLRALQEADADERLALIADAVKDFGGSSQETARHLQNLGFTQGTANDFFSAGGDAIRDARSAIVEYGLSMSAVDAAQVEAANDAWARTSMHVESLRNRLAVEFAPILHYVADLINGAALEAGGFGDAASTAMDVGVRGAGLVMDSVEGVRRVFLLTGQAAATGFLAAQLAGATLTEAIITGPVEAVNGLIRQLNALGRHIGAEFKEIQPPPIAMRLREQIEQGKQAVAEGARSMAETLAEPMPSVGFLEGIEAARVASREAARQAVDDREAERRALAEIPDAIGMVAEGYDELAERLELLRRQADPVYDEMRRIEEIFDELAAIDAAGLLKPGEWDALYSALVDVSTGARRSDLALQQMGARLEQMRRQADPAYKSMREIEDVFDELSAMDAEGLLAPGEWDKLFDSLTGVQDAAEDIGDAFADSMRMVRQGVGDMQSLFEAGSSGAKAMTGILQGLNLVEAARAVLKQGSERDPYTAFAGMAAMASSVASMGYAVGLGGGGGGSMSASAQASQGTGGVLGDATAKSDAIASATERTADATGQLVSLSRGMLDALRGVTSGIDTVARLSAREGAPWGALSDQLWRARDAGLQLAGGLGGVDVAGYGRGLVRTGGAIGVQDVVTDPLDAYGEALTGTLQGLADTVRASAAILGLGADEVEAALAAYTMDGLRISLQGLDASEQAEEMAAVFGSIFSELAVSVAPYIDDFVRLGEDAGEAFVEVATRIQLAEEAATRLGYTAGDLAGPELARAAYELVELAGGASDFASQMEDFGDTFGDAGHKLDISTREVAAAFARVGLAVPRTRDEMMTLMRTLDATTESGREQIAMLLSISDAAGDYYIQLERGEADLSDAYQRSLADAYRLIDAYDDSARSQEQLAHAHAIAQAAAGALSQALADAGTHITRTFGDLSLSIRESLMAEGELYAHRQAQVDALMHAMTTITDPAELMRTADEIERITSQMWQSLDPSQRGALGGGFLDFLDQADDAFQGRLADLQADVQREADLLGSTIADAMMPSASQMMEAAAMQAETARVFSGAVAGFGEIVGRMSSILSQMQAAGNGGGREIVYA